MTNDEEREEEQRVLQRREERQTAEGEHGNAGRTGSSPAGNTQAVLTHTETHVTIVLNAGVNVSFLDQLFLNRPDTCSSAAAQQKDACVSCRWCRQRALGTSLAGGRTGSFTQATEHSAEKWEQLPSEWRSREEHVLSLPCCQLDVCIGTVLLRRRRNKRLKGNLELDFPLTHL
ncbi:hypothetical protein EYF80_004846 [Liparis tanakae]|uniref:Uncharacterized protein n=1 Tax=Liparis tanakae TaxID=230148 RepID=A0A4Z2J4C9_9TELE|nr:hypothetical protein EYF80_004846 [Liparis tanakae]